ncbi:MAG: hypothetical protein NUK65_00980 [Firmicutes bacterium]|nr:hypothetical protein [Bacillota bacterium]
MPEKLDDAEEIIFTWEETCVRRPVIGLVNKDTDQGRYAYWPRFERFLHNNNLTYKIISIEHANWVEQLQDIDILVWRPDSNPAKLAEAKTKIHFVSSILKKVTCPSDIDLWYYEDKIRQYYLLANYQLPVVNTFISHDYKETLEFLEQTKYPLIFKENIAYASNGVVLVTNKRQAQQITKKIFNQGYKTYWQYLLQKNVVYFQDFIPSCQYDLRVIVIGEYFWGYYRRVPPRDFRASGAWNVDKRGLPSTAMLLARRVKQALQASFLAVDMIKADDASEYQIIEVSTFIQIISAEQLIVDGEPGRYLYQDGEFIFQKGRFWIQELMLAETIKLWQG